MSVPSCTASGLLAVALLLLAACGGPVASDAPALLTVEQIAARADVEVDTTRGVRAASDLAWRGAQLRARAAQIRRSGLPAAERQSLLHRAEQMKSR